MIPDVQLLTYCTIFVSAVWFANELWLNKNVIHVG